MAYIQAENYRFYYPGETRPAVDIRKLEIDKGSFCLLAGESGCGKTTVLRQLSGSIILQGKEEGKIDSHAVLSAYVWQDPVSQIVTDRTEYEIVFGMENTGMPKEQMQRRLAEVVTFFGLDGLMNRDTMSLSGGEMQTLNVAAAIAMNPDLLLLDEPASQLDPVAARHFYELLRQVSEELGITIIIAEQRLEDVVSMADQLILMQEGRICGCGRPEEVFLQIPDSMLSFFPSYMQVYYKYKDKESFKIPLTMKMARKWFCSCFQSRTPEEIPEQQYFPERDSRELVQCRKLYFRYEKNLPDVLNGCSFAFAKGEITCLAGGNGSGKSTLLEILYGRFRAYHGKIVNLPGRMAYLPQQPAYLFLADTVKECCSGKDKKMAELLSFFGLDELCTRHPADLSGGEQQRLGLCRILGTESDLYLLDEPTKGLDTKNKVLLGSLLQKMAGEGKTILFVSHDMEFAAGFADRMALIFQGRVELVTDTRSFFVENQFYTTGMNRIAREVSPFIITQEDVEVYAEKKNH